MGTYRLDIFRENRVKYMLLGQNLDEDGRNLVMAFMEPNPLKENDLLWAQKDILANDTDNMILISREVLGRGYAIDRPPGTYHFPLRDFEVGEIFELIASYTEINEEESLGNGYQG